METVYLIFIPLGLFFTGLVFAYLAFGVMARVFDAINPVGLGFALFIFGFITPFAAFGLSRSVGNPFAFWGGVVISGFFLLAPIRMIFAIYLLWWNPRKYKEYEMKQRRLVRQNGAESRQGQRTEDK
ncbi:hypothetical protein BH10ACI2_BH10ACI2_21920 [soil metagenome]